MARTAWPTVISGDAWSAAQHNTYGRDNDLAYWVGTTAGDTEYYDSASTRARIPIGTAGQQKTVNAGATAPEWATTEGMKLIEEFTAAGGETSYTFSAIPQTFRHLRLIISGRSLKVGQTYAVICAQVNGDTGANYSINSVLINNNVFTQSYSGAYTYLFLGYIQCTSAAANYPNVMDILIPYYTGAVFYKVSQSINTLIYSASLASSMTDIRHAVWRNTAAITSLKVWMVDITYSFAANSKLSLYGLI